MLKSWRGASAVMRIALLLTAIILLSGCAVRVSHEETGSVEGGSDSSQTHSSCTVTRNGKTQSCESLGEIQGPKENVTIDERGSLLEGLEETWRFAVHPNATTAEVRFSLMGHDGAEAGLHAQDGCIRLSGAVSASDGPCGGGGTTISVGSDVLVTDEKVLLSQEDLARSDYTLDASFPPVPADYHVVITVAYA